MACSSCSKRKIIRQQSNVVTLANATYNNSDFSLYQYIGESQTVVGSVTGINYGYRETNSTFLVHKDDVNELFVEV